MSEFFTGCYLCGNINFHQIYDKERNDRPLKTYACEKCGFIITLPRPTKDDLEEYYVGGDYTNEEALQESKVRSKTPSAKEFQNFERISSIRLDLLFKSEKAFNILSTKESISSLDIGSGHGNIPFLLKKYGFEAEGVELDLTLAKQSSDFYNIKVHGQNFDEFNPDKKYDLITAFHVMEHVEDPNLFLEKIYNILNEDGILNIEVPIIDILYTGNLKRFFWKAHINTFSMSTLISFLQKNGFEILQDSSKLNRKYYFGNIVAKKIKSFDFEINKDEFKRVKAIIDGVGDYDGPPIFIKTSKNE